jgi:NACHT domain
VTDEGLNASAGGAHDEAGGQYRRALAALFVAHALNGLEFQGLPLGGQAGTVESVALETDTAVDDIVVVLRGGRLFMQAKRTLRWGRPLEEAARQWLSAVRDADFNSEADFVAAAGGKLSSSVTALGRALDRLRSSGASLTGAERDAIDKLRALLVRLGATDDEIGVITRRAVLLRRAVEEDWEEHAELGRLLLDQHVVKKGDGGRAWRELVAIAGRAARLRVGYTTAGWLTELRKCGVPLTADAEASRAAALERRRSVLERYRQKLVRRGETLDLTRVGARLPAIPLADIDAGIDVRDPGDSESTGLKLLLAFRRRGRAILTGLPGGGKSTAMAAVVAGWAQRDHLAVPIAVSLRRLAEKERFRRRPLRDEIVDLACEIAEPSDRLMLRDALDQALGEGDAVLFLDGLDEAADRSLELAADLARLLDDLHPDTDVLLTTRDVAYADAGVLHFRDLALNRPRDPDRAVRGVLRAIASHRRQTNADSWVERRVEWIKRTLALDRELAETPLLPVLLALLAGDSETDALPRSRARILAGVIEDIVRRHEVNRETGLSTFSREQVAEALIAAFPLIAAKLEAAGGSAPRNVLAEVLIPYVRDSWGLPSEAARVSAFALLRFWDESGIFVARGRDRLTAPRLQLFLEIGAALHAARQPEEDAIAFVQRCSAREDRRETLVLAAGLSSAIAEALIDRAREAGDERLALAAATALTQGGRASGEHVRELIRHLITLLTPGDDEAWRVFTTLVRLPVPLDLQDAVLAALIGFDREHILVGTAVAALDWGITAEWRNRALEDALRVDTLPALPRRQPRTSRYATAADLMVDQAFMRVKEQASELLLPTRPELAPVVAAALRHASTGTTQRLLEILRRNGYTDLANAAWKDIFATKAFEQLTHGFMDIDIDVRRTLDTIASLAVPAVLAKSQRRRLNELAAFVEALNLNHGGAWLKGSTLDRLREPWYRLIAAVGGFDLATLAAEAEVVRAEELSQKDGDRRHDLFFSLFDSPAQTNLDRWSNFADPPAGRELALQVLAGPWAVAIVAGQVLATHPQRGETARAIRALLRTLPRTSKKPAVWALLKLTDEVEPIAAQLIAEPDEAIREAVASVVRLTEAGGPTSLGITLAIDRERTVQLAAIEQFRKDAKEPVPEMIALLEQVAAQPSQPFRCHSCGTANGAERDSCLQCNVVTAKPSEEARELLGKLRGLKLLPAQ